MPDPWTNVCYYLSMGTEKEKAIAAAIDLLIKEGFKKPVRKKGRKRNLDLEIVYLLGRESVFVKKGKKFSPRKVQKRVAKSAAFNAILDKHFKGKKRKSFDNMAVKDPSDKTFVKDLREKGLFKKFRLVERCYGKYFNTELFKTVSDPDYFPPNYDKKLKKGIIALGKGGVRKLAAAAAKKASSQK